MSGCRRRGFGKALPTQHRQGVNHLDHVETTVFQNDVRSETDAACGADTAARTRPAVVKGNDTVGGNERAPVLPITAKPLIAVIAIDKYEIHRWSSGDCIFTRRLDTRCTYPHYRAIVRSGNLTTCDDLLHAESQPPDRKG